MSKKGGYEKYIPGKKKLNTISSSKKEKTDSFIFDSKSSKTKKGSKSYYYDNYGIHLIDTDSESSSGEYQSKSKKMTSKQIEKKLAGSKQTLFTNNFAGSKCTCPKTKNYYTSKICNCNKKINSKTMDKSMDKSMDKTMDKSMDKTMDKPVVVPFVRKPIKQIKEKKEKRSIIFGSCDNKLHQNGNTRNIKLVNFCYPVKQLEIYNPNDPISMDCDIFRVGMDPNTDPESGFSFVRDNCHDGLDVAISQLVSKKLKKKLVIVSIPFNDLTDALMTGKIDMIASQMNRTSYRSNKIAQISYATGGTNTFTLVLLTTIFNLIKNNVQNNDYITALDQLNKKLAVGVFAGSVQEHYLSSVKRQNKIGNISIMIVDNSKEIIESIKNGFIFGFITDSPIAKDDPEITNIQTAITLPDEVVGDYALGINIQYCTLMEKVYQFINKMYESKFLEKLSNRYRGTYNAFVLDMKKPVCQDIITRDKNCFIDKGDCF